MKSKNFIKDEWLIDENNVKCPICGKIYKKKGYPSHYYRIHSGNEYNFDKCAWNKGLTKENNNSIKNSSIKVKENYKNGKNVPYWKGKHPGWYHINSDIKRRSYPEKFFIKVFQNYNIYSKYDIIEKMPFGKYFLDFAFPEIFLDLEIDGNQHYRNIENIKHDKQRDIFVNQKGWNIIRIKWEDVCNDPQKEIESLLVRISQLDENCATNADDEGSTPFTDSKN